jgi:Na+(H+)/acetate symporter ActP
VEDPRQKAVIRWLTILWVAALGICVSHYFTVDITNHRQSVDWAPIFIGMLLATGIYLGLFLAAKLIWERGGRVIILLAALVGSVFIVPFVGLIGLLAAWAYNLVQYLLMVLLAYCVVHIAYRCLVAPKAKADSS